MTRTTRWWWVRHARVINPDGVIYGQTDFDVELSDQDGFRFLTHHLPQDAVWLTTRLSRACRTARRLLEEGGSAAVLRQDDRFLEQAFGDWEGSRWDDIPQAISAAYWRDPVATRAPGGESFADVVARVGAAIDQVNADCTGRDIVVVAHAGSIRAALVHALGCAPSAGLAFHIGPLSLTRLEAIPADGVVWWRVAGVNLPGDAP